MLNLDFSRLPADLRSRRDRVETAVAAALGDAVIVNPAAAERLAALVVDGLERDALRSVCRWVDPVLRLAGDSRDWTEARIDRLWRALARRDVAAILGDVPLINPRAVDRLTEIGGQDIDRLAGDLGEAVVRRVAAALEASEAG